MSAPKILVLQHDQLDPLLRLESWLLEAGAELHVVRCHAGEPLPQNLTGYQGLISLGGRMGALDDEQAPWLPATRLLLAAAVADRVPALGICLGSQLLAAATGGRVVVAADGPEIGAHLTAKRDAAEEDPLFGPLPMTPDVVQYHYDVVTELPPGAVLLLSGTKYQHQAWRLGECAWGVQFHLEPAAEDVRSWARQDGRDPADDPRLTERLDEAAENMAVVWREFAHRFVEVAGDRRAGTLAGRRIPLGGRH